MARKTPKHGQRDYLQPKPNVHIHDLGRLVAEEDRHLAEYYVGREKYVERALNLHDPAVFFRGPKGVGKSAVLEMVRIEKARDERRLISISPDDLAFSALANVDCSTPILSAAERSQWLFKTLWDYVLAVEILRRELPDLPTFLVNIFGGKQKKQARKLLELSLDDDGTQRTLTQRILELIREVEMTGSAEGLNLSAKVILDKTAAGPQHLTLLSQINQVAKGLSSQIKHDYFILIDDLDLHWNDSDIQNAFIAALFMSLRKLNKPPLRFLVAIRDDIYYSGRERLHLSTRRTTAIPRSDTAVECPTYGGRSSINGSH